MSNRPSEHRQEDTDAAWAQLAAGFDRILAGLPKRLREASERLLPRVRSQAVNQMHWATTFARLTAMYPTLQAAPVLDRDVAAKLNLAHLLLLIHTFIDDRVTDRQIDVQPTEIEFAEEMCSKAVHILESVSPESAARCFSDAHARYAESKDRTAVAEPDPLECVVRAEQVAVDRAALGGVAPRVLEAASSTSAEAQVQLQKAYDAWALGLQWIDDAEDWHEDLMRGQDNLVLLALRQQGVDAYQEPPAEPAVSNVATALLATDAIGFAITCSLQWLERAAAVHRELGRDRIEAEIRALQDAIRESRSRLTMNTAGEAAVL